MPYILAIDQSTSATKALIFDEVGQRVDRQSCDHQQFYPQPGWVEHDAEEIWQNVLKVCQSLLNRNQHIVDELVGISITNQRETVVVFDRETGKPLHPAIVWQCRRSEALCATHVKAGCNPWVHAQTGLRIDPYFSASKVQWLMHNSADLKDKIQSGEAIVGTIDTFLIYRLTQCRVFATDSTNASRTLFFNIETLKWSEELCGLWGVPMSALAQVRDSGDSFGESTIDGILNRALPIVGVMGDSQASLFAQRCFKAGTAKVTFGTGSSVLLNIGANLLLSEIGLVTALAWVRDGKPVYAFEGIIINCAATLEWLKNQLGLVAEVAEIEALARSVDDSGGVFLVPAFSGLGFPHWAPDARAAILGLSGYSDRRHLARAGLESIGYQLRDAVDAMQAESGVNLLDLKADGGPTINALLMQFTADITQTKLDVSASSDCSARGAALIGLLGLGFYKSLEEITQLKFDDVVYHPSRSDTAVQRLHSGWQHAVNQVLSGTQSTKVSEINQ